MSVHVKEDDTFTKIYGTAFISAIRSKYDLDPLFSNLIKKNKGKIIIIKKPHLRFFDVFSQTMYKFGADSCPELENILSKNNIVINEYKHLPLEPFLEFEKKSKKLLRYLPNNLILIPTKLEILNDKLIIRFKYPKEQDEIVSEIVRSLNKLYNTNRVKQCFFVVGFIKDSSFSIDSDSLYLLPSRVEIEFPILCRYRNFFSYFEMKEN